MEDLDANYGTFLLENKPKAPSKSQNKKHKKKKKKLNNDEIKEQSTKKKKKQHQQHRAKKKNDKNKNDEDNNRHKKKKMKQKQTPAKKKKKNKKRKRKNKKEYKIGIVMILPQRNNIWGWIYCKSNNMMYRLSYCDKVTTLQINQKVLFFPNNDMVKDIHLIHLLSLDSVTNNYLNDKKESISNQDRFVMNTSINCIEDNKNEFKHYARAQYNKWFRDNMVYMIEKYLNGFINMNGGTIYIGINDDGIVKGIDFIDKKELDIIYQILPDKLNKWKPEIYTHLILKSFKLEMKDIVYMDNKEKCAYIIPKHKVIQASIGTIYNESTKEQIICYASDGFVYAREGATLSVYDDITMTLDRKCGKAGKNKRFNYGFWIPQKRNNNKNKNKNGNIMDYTVFDEGDDMINKEKKQSQNNSSNTSESYNDTESSADLNAEDESHSIVYFSDHDTDSDDIDSDDDKNKNNNTNYMKYTQRYNEDSDEDRDDSENMKYVKKTEETEEEEDEEEEGQIMDELTDLKDKNDINDDDNKRRKSYSAVFDYKGGKISNELLFSRNDDIIVDDEKENGLYLHGYKENEPNDKGWFPNSYAKENIQ